MAVHADEWGPGRPGWQHPHSHTVHARRFAGVDQTFIMGDVTFGACCVDDFSAQALGADFLVRGPCCSTCYDTLGWAGLGCGAACARRAAVPPRRPCAALAGPRRRAPGPSSSRAPRVAPPWPPAGALRPLVPGAVDVTGLPCMYVFVDIKMDTQHLVDSIRCVPCALLVVAGGGGGGGGGRGVCRWWACSGVLGCARVWRCCVWMRCCVFGGGCTEGRCAAERGRCAPVPPFPCRHNFAAGARLVLAGTIQFASCIAAAKQQLLGDYPHLAVPQVREGRGGAGGVLGPTWGVAPCRAAARLPPDRAAAPPPLPQARPLSPGEVLGCTAPRIQGDCDAIVFVADGRFHLEALMIANPTVSAYRCARSASTGGCACLPAAGLQLACSGVQRRAQCEGPARRPRPRLLTCPALLPCLPSCLPACLPAAPQVRPVPSPAHPRAVRSRGHAGGSARRD